MFEECTFIVDTEAGAPVTVRVGFRGGVLALILVSVLGGGQQEAAILVITTTSVGGESGYGEAVIVSVGGLRVALHDEHAEAFVSSLLDTLEESLKSGRLLAFRCRRE